MGKDRDLSTTKGKADRLNELVAQGKTTEEATDQIADEWVQQLEEDE